MGVTTTKSRKRRMQQLLRVLEGKKTALIVSHTNPDPDTIASSLALQYFMAEVAGIKSVLAYDGIVGRAENRELLEYLNLNLLSLEQIDLHDFDLIALVDTHQGMGNNPLPPDISLGIEIDHHQTNNGDRLRAEFSDIREDYGSTATILVDYLLSAGLKISTRLATALFYAIKAETQDLGREAKKADQKAYFTLYQLIDFQALAKIQRASVSPEYFQDMSRAIRRTAVFDDVVISTPGKVDSPDMIAEMADTFLRLRMMRWAVVIGFHGDHMFISVRTNRPEYDAGQLVKKVVARLGTAGGHDMTAGGKIYCEDNYKKQWLLKERVKKRFLAEFGFDRRRKGKKLLAMKSPDPGLIIEKNARSRPA